MKRTNNIKMSSMYCCCCGNKGLPVFRKIGQEREPGHLKKLYCIYCNKETNHVEIKDINRYNLNTFFLEYKYGNFDKDGNRKEPYQIFINNLYKEGVIN